MMKIIHTGDWHIGKVVNEFSMIEDQKFYFEQFIEMIKRECPDAIVIAGDIYDRSVPPAEAVELLDQIFNKIVLELKIPILAIAGNHDSAERLSFGSRMLSDRGLYIAGLLEEKVKKVTLTDQDGMVNFYLLPYADPAKVRMVLKNEDIKNHDDAMKAIIEQIKQDFNEDERNVLIGHGYVTYSYEDKEHRGNLEVCDSERPLSIGGTDLINAKDLDIFNYVALGHLHGAQKVGSDKIRYSGSILKYSISEYRQNKSVTKVELDKGGNVEVELLQVPALRDLRVIRGPIAELTNKEVHEGTNLNDYVFVELTDEGEILDAISKLRAVFPNVMGLKMVNSINNRGISKTAADENFREKSMEELFEEFYQNIKGKEMDEGRIKEVQNILENIERG